MVLHPDVYTKAQEEVDRVIGTTRLPTLEDRRLLPYINSVLLETYRCVFSQHRRTQRLDISLTSTLSWHPPVPLGGRPSGVAEIRS